jgi:HPt (histidine-containing phosphotransfer) domain-containing protein
MKRFRRENDIRSLTIKIHALKSTARIIGAEKLGAFAETLEKAGNANDTVTLESGVDALLRKLQITNMPKALLTDAMAGAAIEQICNDFQEELQGRFPNMQQTMRYSPGYGDLPLSLQPELLALTAAQRRLGVTLTESLLMVPSKSVTAIVGICDAPQPARIRGCAFCSLNKTCTFRKGGTTCAAS